MRVWVISVGDVSHGSSVRAVATDQDRGQKLEEAMAFYDYCYGGSDEWQRDRRGNIDSSVTWRNHGAWCTALPFEVPDLPEDEGEGEEE